MASLASSNTMLPPHPSKSNNTAFPNASFSSYLNNTEEKYTQTLVKAIQNNTEEKYTHTLVKTIQNPKPKKIDDGEIDIFSADKYFNGGVNQEKNTTSVKHQNQVRENHNKAVTQLSKSNLQPRTPSIYSESSWNSQTALLKRVQRNPSRKKSSFMPCYCCDKKSIVVEDQDHVNKNVNNAYERPITRTIKTSLDTAEIMRLNKLRLDPKIENEETRRKKSLDVFGSDEGSKRFSLEKRLNMLSWDAIPRSVEEINSSGPPSETCKDTDSVASSDLFEIECVSCTGNPVVAQGARNMSDVCTTPTAGYAPSEASVDWSVVTASEDQRSIVTSMTRGKVGSKPASSAKPSYGGMLSGCKSQKSVRVAEDVSRSPVKKKTNESHRMHSPVTRFQAEAKLPGHGLRQPKNTSSSDILYIF